VTLGDRQERVRNNQQRTNRKQPNRLAKNVAEEGNVERKTMRTLNDNKKVDVIRHLSKRRLTTRLSCSTNTSLSDDVGKNAKVAQ
jgi:hypothetical protein